MTKRVFLAAGIIAGLYFLSVYVKVYFHEKEAGKGMEMILGVVARPWGEQRIMERASLALAASGPEKQLRSVTLLNEVLGNFVRLNETPSCKLAKQLDSFSRQELVYATCRANVEFEKKAVTFGMRLVEQDEEWRLDDYKVEK